MRKIIIISTIFSDIDECSSGAANGYCYHFATCTDTTGSFGCGCPTSYVLNPDKRTCSGKYHKVKHENIDISVYFQHVQNFKKKLANANIANIIVK